MLAVASCVMVRLPVSVCIIRGSRFAVAACINGETVIFYICCTEALCSLSLHETTARPQSVRLQF